MAARFHACALEAGADGATSPARPEKIPRAARIDTASNPERWQIDFMRIGVVDDSEVDRFITRRVILRAFPDAKVVEFPCPVEALRAIRRPTFPSLLLLDMNMPRMSGFELLEQVPPNWRCKVALLTSSSWARDRERALGYPCVHACIEKPLTKGALIDFVLGRPMSILAAE